MDAAVRELIQELFWYSEALEAESKAAYDAEREIHNLGAENNRLIRKLTDAQMEVRRLRLLFIQVDYTAQHLDRSLRQA